MSYHFRTSISVLFAIVFFTPLSVFAVDQFAYSFGFGATDATTHGEVSRLQRLLSLDKSIYPEGIISGRFGKLTERAVQRLQAKNKIVTSGTAATTGYGWIGKKTRAVLNGQVVKLPEMSGSLQLAASGDIISQTGLTARTTYTNKLIASFVGTGNGLKVAITQTSPDKAITMPSSLSCVTPCSVENLVAVGPGIKEGSYQVKVTAVAGKESMIAYYNVIIGAPEAFEFSLTASKGITATKSLSGSVSGTNEIIIRTIKGQTQPVTLTQTSNVKGLVVKNEMGKCTPPCSIANSVRMDLDLVTGIYSVPDVGTAGASTR